MVNVIFAVVVYATYAVRVTLTSNRAKRFRLLSECEAKLDSLKSRASK